MQVRPGASIGDWEREEGVDGKYTEYYNPEFTDAKDWVGFHTMPQWGWDQARFDTYWENEIAGDAEKVAHLTREFNKEKSEGRGRKGRTGESRTRYYDPLKDYKENKGKEGYYTTEELGEASDEWDKAEFDIQRNANKQFEEKTSMENKAMENVQGGTGFDQAASQDADYQFDDNSTLGFDPDESTLTGY